MKNRLLDSWFIHFDRALTSCGLTHGRLALGINLIQTSPLHRPNILKQSWLPEKIGNKIKKLLRGCHPRGITSQKLLRACDSGVHPSKKAPDFGQVGTALLPQQADSSFIRPSPNFVHALLSRRQCFSAMLWAIAGDPMVCGLTGCHLRVVRSMVGGESSFLLISLPA